MPACSQGKCLRSGLVRQQRRVGRVQTSMLPSRNPLHCFARLGKPWLGGCTSSLQRSHSTIKSWLFQMQMCKFAGWGRRASLSSDLAAQFAHTLGRRPLLLE